MSKLIKIIRGTYGWCPPHANYVKPIGEGDGAIRVDDEKAAKLVAQKVAVYAEDTDERAVYPAEHEPSAPAASDEQAAEPSTPAAVTPTAEEIDAMTIAELTACAGNWNIDLAGASLKADIVAAVKAFFGYE